VPAAPGFVNAGRKGCFLGRESIPPAADKKQRT